MIKRASPGAVGAGIREGVSLALGQAMMPTARIEQFDPIRDCRALVTLAEWCIRFAPHVGVEREIIDFLEGRRKEGARSTPDSEQYGIILNVTGTERYHRGESALVARIVQEMRRRRLNPRVAIAPTLGAAWGLSRYATLHSGQIIIETINELCRSLPLQALRIERASVTLLNRLGITTIAGLLKLPKNTLASRFGEQILIRLYQFLGKLDEPFRSISPEGNFVGEGVFEAPLSRHEQIVRAAIETLHELLAKLAGAHRKAGRFVFLFESLNIDRSSTVIEREFSLYAASNEHQHLVSVIAPALENIASPGGISKITVRASDLEWVREEQGDFIAPRSEHGDRVERQLLTRLSSGLGKQHIARLYTLDSYLPERSFGFRSIEDRRPISTSAMINEDRPPLLFSTPESIDAISLLPDRPPSRIRWKGDVYQIVYGLGPERICEEWWHKGVDSAVTARDYFRLQDTEGHWLWVFRNQRTMEWFIHGVWI